MPPHGMTALGYRTLETRETTISDVSAAATAKRVTSVEIAIEFGARVVDVPERRPIPGTPTEPTGPSPPRDDQ